MKTPRQHLGRWGEQLVAEYLESCGYLIIDRNARTPYGEIDLVTRQVQAERVESGNNLGVLVFVEVKTRSSRAYGYPEESVTPRKQAHMLAAAQAYLQTHPELEGEWRIDVISVERSGAKGNVDIVHFENAITNT